MHQRKSCLVSQDSPYSMTLVSSNGDRLYDQNGKEYIDLMMGWCVGNLGWGRKEIIREITQYHGPDYVYPGFRFQPWERLAGKLAGHAPGGLEMCYRATGGSESVDTALQIAMTYTNRKKIVSIRGAYHGNSISALSIGDRDSRSALPNKLNGCLTIAPPLEESTLRKVETKLKNRDVAAFILEPVICNLGVLIPDKKFITGLRELCSHYGTLLIADEVACGFGRTGKLFACSHYGLEPDILCLAKAMSGGYLGIGATLTKRNISDTVKDRVSIYSTYGWHPRSTIAALAVLDLITRNEKDFFSHVEKRSQQFRTGLSQLPFKKNCKLSMIGLAITVDVEENSYAGKIRKKAFEKGLIIGVQGSQLVLFPSLTITRETVSRALRILEDSV